MAEETIDREELLRQLSFIKNPVIRLRKYIKHGLLDVFREELYVLIGEHTIYFQHGDRNEGYKQIDNGTCDMSEGPESEPVIVIAEIKARITINGIRKIFRWTKTQTRDFVEMCLLEAIKVDPRDLRKQIASWIGSWEINATSRALELFARKRWEGRNNVHRWLLTAWWFDDAYIFCYFGDKSYERWLGCVPPKRFTSTRDNTPVLAFDVLRHEVAVIEGVVKKLEELGATRWEIDNLFADWLVKYGAGGLDSRWPAAMAFFDRVARGRTLEVSDRVRLRFLGRPYDTFDHLFGDEGRRPCLELHMLLRVVEWQNDEELWAAFRAKIVERLSRGQLGLVSYALIEMSPYLKDFQLSDCAAEAVQIALSKEQYGIAAALVNHFGAEVCINADLLKIDLEASDGDEEEARATAVEARRTVLREAAGLAGQLGQSIQLQL